MRKTLAIALCLAAAALSAADAPKNVFALMEEARQAYARGDKAAFLKDYEEAAKLRPGYPLVLYNLACAQALNGQTQAALATLRAYAAQRLVADLDGDTDFDSLRSADGYKRIVAEMATLRAQRITSGAAVAFTIPEKEVAAEGVAYDPVTKAFFVASVRKGKIFRIGAGGKISEFVAPGSGLRSALGMGVDAGHRTLWVASEAIPMMNGARDGDAPQSALFEFDLDTGRLRKEHRPPEAKDPPYFDDLTVASDGRVYVNDGRSPRIYVFDPAGGALEVFLETDAMRGTQGLAVTPDGRTLYASDYGGLYRVDVATRSVVPLPVPPDVSLSGVDGLVYADGRLVTIQNGVQPNRVSVFELAPDGLHIAHARILEMNHPAFDEPTLGTVVDGFLYFSANNQGHRYFDKKNPPRPEDLQEAVILRVPIR